MREFTRFESLIILDKNMPEHILKLLTRLLVKRNFGTTDKPFVPKIAHPFFKCEDWTDLFRSTWHKNQELTQLYQKDNGYWVMYLKAYFKANVDTVNKFVDWITPYVAGRKKKLYIGWFKGTSWGERRNLYVEREFKHKPKPTVDAEDLKTRLEALKEKAVVMLASDSISDIDKILIKRTISNLENFFNKKEWQLHPM